MRTFVVFSALLAVAMAGLLPHSGHQSHAPGRDHETYVLRETPSNNIGLDKYQYGYELSDGQTRQESAYVDTRYAKADGEGAVLRVQGSYSYYNPYDGQTYTITYIADENGFQPRGAHIPVAPQLVQ